MNVCKGACFLTHRVYVHLYVQCYQTADGLAFLHSVKPPILHRDLRSANILMDSSGRVKVLEASGS